MITDTSIYKMNLQGISQFDDKMTFYYDETGNCRQFSLTENGFNNLDSVNHNFILGGICFDKQPDENELKIMYSNLGYIEGEQKELKFKHLYHNSKDFLNFMGSKRASTFLKWLSNSGVYIHYLTLNNLYYSLVDIVDSLDSEIIVNYNIEIKNALYNFTINHTDDITKLLYQHEYPNIIDVGKFVDEFVFLLQNSKQCKNFFLKIICYELKNAKKNNELVFIQNNDPYILISEYYHFYLRRCGEFSKSIHIFDEEKRIQTEFNKIVLKDNGKTLSNYSFINSADNKFIQVSDMFIGLLSKLFYFLDNNTKEELSSIQLSLSESQHANFRMINYLILKSIEKSPLLICNINSRRNIIDREKKLAIISK